MRAFKWPILGRMYYVDDCPAGKIGILTTEKPLSKSEIRGRKRANSSIKSLDFLGFDNGLPVVKITDVCSPSLEKAVAYRP